MKNDQDRYIWLTDDDEHIAFYRDSRLCWTGITVRDAITGKEKYLYRDEGTDPRLLEGLTILTVELEKKA